jgi:hypothetical protein
MGMGIGPRALSPGIWRVWPVHILYNIFGTAERRTKNCAWHVPFGSKSVRMGPAACDLSRTTDYTAIRLASSCPRPPPQPHVRPAPRVPALDHP